MSRRTLRQKGGPASRHFEGIPASAWDKKPEPILPEHNDAECPVLADDNLFAGELDRPEYD